MKKRLCVLQVTPSEPTKEHVDLFSNKRDCDFYFVTHDKDHPDAMRFCPNTTWVDTRNVLASEVPKNYDYYAFVDYDFIFEPQGNLNALEQMLEDLEEYEPAVLTYYPGPGFHTPFNQDTEYFNKYDYSIIPFTHCGMKVVHHSLMNWFFPMVTKFGGGMDACHLFNIQEIPFLKHVVCSHKMIYDNGVTDLESPHNKDAIMSKINMDKMWMWIYPYFNKRKILRDDQIKSVFGNKIPQHIEEYATYSNSIHIKNVFVNLFKKKIIKPKKSSKDVDYYDLNTLSRFFDLSHDHFTKKEKDILVVVGNGPSLKEEFFEAIKELDIDTMGLNSAYRYFKKMNWYPKYYGCFDYALTESHKEEWSKMILDPDNPIEKYFLIERPSIEAALPNTDFYFSDEIRNHPKYVERPHNQDGLGYPHFGTDANKISCTGANAVRTGVELGYKKIILIGHDATYVQSKDLKEAKFIEGSRYVIDEEPSKNPNYFWDDYQKKGDLFHNPGSPVDAWHKLGECLQIFSPEIDIVNCSEGSVIQCFRFGNFYNEVK